MLKNRFLIALGLLLIIVITMSAFLFSKSQAATYNVENVGAVVTPEMLIPVKTGDSIKKVTNDLSRVNGQSFDSNSFFVSEDGMIVAPLEDSYIVDSVGNIYFVPAYTEITMSGNEYTFMTGVTLDEPVVGSEFVVYSPNETQFAYLSPLITFGNLTFENSVIVNRTVDGSYTLATALERVSYVQPGMILTGINSIEIDTLMYKTATKNVNLSSTIESEEVVNPEALGDAAATGGDNGAATEEPEPETIQDGNNFILGEDVIIIGFTNFLADWIASWAIDVPKITVMMTPLWNSVNAVVTLEDPAGYLESASISLLDKAGNELQRSDLIFSENSIEVSFGQLSPETDYVLRVNMTYVASGVTYQTIPFEQAFRTNDYTAELTLLDATTTSLTVNVKVNPLINYQEMNLVISGNGHSEEKPVNLEQARGQSGATVIFEGLTNNLEYVVGFAGVRADGKAVPLAGDISVMTKKTIPTIGAPQVTTYPQLAAFEVAVYGLKDPDFLVENITYNVYLENGNDVVSTVSKKYEYESRSYQFKIEGPINRDTMYQFEIVVSGSDNYNTVEVSSGRSPSFMITGVEPPFGEIRIISTQGDEVTFEVMVTPAASLGGSDPQVSLLDVNGAPVVGVPTVTFPADGQWHEYTFNTLEPRERYSIVITASFDLQDGQPAYENYRLAKVDVYGHGSGFGSMFTDIWVKGE